MCQTPSLISISYHFHMLEPNPNRQIVIMVPIVIIVTTWLQRELVITMLQRRYDEFCEFSVQLCICREILLSKAFLIVSVPPWQRHAFSGIRLFQSPCEVSMLPCQWHAFLEIRLFKALVEVSGIKNTEIRCRWLGTDGTVCGILQASWKVWDPSSESQNVKNTTTLESS